MIEDFPADSPSGKDRQTNELLAQLMPPTGVDYVASLLTGEISLDPGNVTVPPVLVEPYYDEHTGTLRNGINGHGIGYDRDLTHITGILMVPEEEFDKVLGEVLDELDMVVPPSPEVVHDDRLEMTVSVAAVRVEGTLWLRTNLLPNEHDIEPMGPKCYSVDIASLPPAYRTKYGDHIARIDEFNIGMLTPNVIVGLINEAPTYHTRLEQEAAAAAAYPLFGEAIAKHLRNLSGGFGSQE